MNQKEYIMFALIIVPFSVYMTRTYYPRIEQKLCSHENQQIQIQDSQRYIWSIESIERGDYWETDTEPWVADGFFCFIYGEHEAEVCLPSSDTRYYKQAER